MPVPPSVQRELDRVQEAVKAIRARKALDPIRANDIYVDDIIDFSCEVSPRVFKWLSGLPSDLTQLEHSDTAPEMTADMYKDLLNWAASNVQRLEKELDKHEMDHETPLALRNPTAIAYNTRAEGISPSDLNIHPTTRPVPPINPAILQSLKAIFDSVHPRSTHAFFTNWRTIQAALVDIHRLLNMNYESFSSSKLRHMLTAIEHDIDLSNLLLVHIATQLTGVSHSLDEVGSRRRVGDGASLHNAFSVEGSAYRRWVSAFPEVVAGEVGVDVAERVLRMGTPELSMDWKNNYQWKEEGEEKTGGLGWMWESEREYDLEV
ncbi:uncharacterized protein N0V89_004755 [Didymosphaeria variabile]|uniref:Uncharacterized protein n=1 Tax=Didymosphaeria variabile TaxID=1932322 RepID=A0A9W8XQG5_9PLEO|nr:uncharacterized protein N0V89_004755 [Didymosphaeria variabile]KAJ4356719.1 hypothetical protein N0V89_004755 [Didymosphaeria variabile]